MNSTAEQIKSPSSAQQLHATMQGCAPNGQQAKVISLINNKGMSCSFLNIGATWLSCTLPVEGHEREVLLGVNTLDKFFQQQACLGATVGRFANRIKAGQFAIDGVNYQLNSNHPEHCLHGGKEGFHQRVWQVLEQSQTQVVFALTSPDGDQGFPGQFEIKVTYRLTDDNELRIDYYGKINKACPVNLTNHAYFNLQGADSLSECLEHSLILYAEQYVPNNEHGLPLGHFANVQGTGFDFRQAKTLKQHFLQDEQQKIVGGYDHSFLLHDWHNDAYLAAKATSPDKKVTMNVRTSKPAVQLYTGNFLQGCPNRTDSVYNNYAGFALETQFIPDSPNHPEWTNSQSILRPDETYQYHTIYQFNC